MDLAVFCCAWYRNVDGTASRTLRSARYWRLWLWLLDVGCGEAVRPFIFSGPIPTVPRESLSPRTTPGPRNPPARAGTFRGPFS